MRTRSRGHAVILLGLVVLLAFGCRRADELREATEYRPLRFQTGPAMDIEAVLTNGSISIRGEVGRTETEITAILVASGRSLDRAQRRVEDLDISLTQQGERIEIRFEPPKEAETWSELPTARFEILTSDRGALHVEATDGSVRVVGIDGEVSILAEGGEVDVRQVSGTLEVQAATAPFGSRR